MRVPRLVVRNLRRRPLATVLTSLSVALGVGLFAAIGALREAGERAFQRSATVCNLVVGAKGSSLQLVLNSLYHVGQSPGNVPYELYQEVDDMRGALWTAPIAVGDAYRGHRVVGITGNFFEEVRLGQEKQPLGFAAGGAFDYGREELDALKAEIEGHDHSADAHEHDLLEEHPELLQAVIGAQAARGTGLGLGDRFVPSHGLEEGAIEAHEEAAAEVVGVLEPTGTPIDRAIFVPLGTYYAIAGHQPDETTPAGGARDPRGVSAILVQAKPGYYAINLWRDLNDRLDAQAARPADQVRTLFRLVDTGDQILRVVSMMVVVVALVGVMVSIYNTMGARRKEFAILRALGARRRTLLGMVTAESASLALIGGAAGLVLAGLIVWFGGGQLQELAGISISALPGREEWTLLVAVTLAGGLAGLVPALSAYRTEAARHLSANL